MSGSYDIRQMTLFRSGSDQRYVLACARGLAQLAIGCRSDILTLAAAFREERTFINSRNFCSVLIRLIVRSTRTAPAVFRDVVKRLIL